MRRKKFLEQISKNGDSFWIIFDGCIIELKVINGSIKIISDNISNHAKDCIKKLETIYFLHYFPLFKTREEAEKKFKELGL